MMTDNTRTEYDFLCRACLKVLRRAGSLARQSKNVSKWYDLFSSEDFVQKYLACTRLSANIDDGFPKILCPKCYKQINEIYAFQTMCKASELKLRELKSSSGTETKTNMSLDRMLKVEDEKPFANWISVTEKSVNGADAVGVSQEETENVKATASDEVYITKSEVTTKVKPQVIIGSDITHISSNESSEEEEQKAIYAMVKDDSEESLAGIIEQAETVKHERPNRICADDFEYSDNSVSSDLARSGRKYKRIRNRKSEKQVTFLYCDRCPKRFMIERKLVAHKRKHDGLIPYPCTHTGCTRQFKRWNSLAVHLKQHTNSTDWFKCTEPDCQKMYQHKPSLKIHMRREHGVGLEVKKHCCEICGKMFASSVSLADHRYIHKDKSELPYVCDQPNCNRRFVKKDKLKNHLLRHAGIKNFICPECGLRKTTRNELTIHMRYHNKSISFPCQFCSSAFNNSGNLKRHISIVHEGVRKYECQYCSKRFGKPDTCKYHEMTHTGEKPNVCRECGKRFIQPAALRTHRKVHERQRQKQIKFTVGTSGQLISNNEDQSGIIGNALQHSYSDNMLS